MSTGGVVFEIRLMNQYANLNPPPPQKKITRFMDSHLASAHGGREACYGVLPELQALKVTILSLPSNTPVARTFVLNYPTVFSLHKKWVLAFSLLLQHPLTVF